MLFVHQRSPDEICDLWAQIAQEEVTRFINDAANRTFVDLNKWLMVRRWGQEAKWITNLKQIIHNCKTSSVSTIFTVFQRKQETNDLLFY